MRGMNVIRKKPVRRKDLLKPALLLLVSLAMVILCGAVLFQVLPARAAAGTVTTADTPAVTAPVQETQPPTTQAPADTDLPYTPPVTDSPGTDDSLLNLLDGNDNNQALDLVLLVTLLTLAPSILIMLTCFTRIIIVFSLLRNAMGVQQTPPNQVMIGLALFLTLFIMMPVVNQINEIAYQPYKAGEMSTTEAIQAASGPLKIFMLKNTTNESLEFFLELREQEMPTGTHQEIAAQLGLEVVAPAYIISEIKTGFTIGFLLFIPFLIIDVVVSSVLMSMGMIMLPPAMISLPFKVLLFILVNGWQLLCASLVRGFVT